MSFDLIGLYTSKSFRSVIFDPDSEKDKYLSFSLFPLDLINVFIDFKHVFCYSHNLGTLLNHILRKFRKHTCVTV